jgi:hypothetical protein
VRAAHVIAYSLRGALQALILSGFPLGIEQGRGLVPLMPHVIRTVEINSQAGYQKANQRCNDPSTFGHAAPPFCPQAPMGVLALTHFNLAIEHQV